MSRQIEFAVHFCNSLQDQRFACKTALYIEGVNPMETLMEKWIGPLKVFSHVVVLLMLLAILYAAFISIKYWSGISV
jgi:hypothetical protein